MLAPPGALSLFRVPAAIYLSIQPLNLSTRVSGHLKTGVFMSLVVSFTTILCSMGRSGGSASGISLTKTSGQRKGMSSFSWGFAMANLACVDFPSQFILTLYSGK